MKPHTSLKRIESPLRKLRQRGAAAVEFALLLPVLVFLLIGFIDLGILFVNDIVLTNAARQGARWGTISTNTNWTTPTCSGSHTSSTDACGVANSYASGALITLGAANQPITAGSGSGTSGGTVTITTTYTVEVLGIDLLGMLMGPTHTLSASVRMSHE